MEGSSLSTVSRRLFLSGLASLPLIGRSGGVEHAEQELSVEETPSAITIENEHLRVTIDREYGGVRQLTAHGPGLALCDPTVDREPRHWRLTFYSDDYQELRADSYNATRPNIEVLENEDRVELLLEWTDIELTSPQQSGAIDSFDGTVECRVVVGAGSPRVRWELDVRNDGDLAIRSASCPYINSIGSLDPEGDDALVLPQLIGKRIRNPTETGPEGVSYPSGFGTMQFTAYTNGSSGFYTHTPDTEGYAKELSWESGREQTIRYRMRHYTPRRPGGDLTIPYPTTVGVLEGDWQAAADRYRAWLLSDGWLSVDDAVLPDWIQRTGAWFEFTSYTRPNYGDPLPEHSYREIVDWMTALSEAIDTPLQLRWRGWQTYGKKHGLDWFPPKEGVAAFETALAELHARDVWISSMISGSLGYEFADFWQENRSRAEDWVIRDTDGDLVEMDYAHGHPEENILYKIEFPRQDYQVELQDRLKKFARAGGDSVNLDGFPWQWVPDCYADDHGHPVGFGGNWYPKQSREALRELLATSRAEQPGFLLGGEGLSDFYFPYLQVGYLRAAAPERHLEVRETENVDLLPVLPYTLGDFHAIQAATVFLIGNVEYQRLAVARALVWGCIPAVNVDYPPENLERDLPTLDYLGRAARARSQYANRFVARSRMLRSPDIDVPTATMETITVEAGDEVNQVWTPAVLSSAWNSDRGEVGFVFTHVSPDHGSIDVSVDLTSQSSQLPAEPWMVYSVRNGDYELHSEGVKSSMEITIDVDYPDVLLVVISPGNESRKQALESIVEAQAVADDDEGEMVEKAKRKFETDQLAESTQLAQTVITEDVTPHTEEPEPTGTPGAVEETGTAGTHAADRRTTSADAPGFTILAGLVGVAGACAKFLWRGLGRRMRENDN